MIAHLSSEQLSEYVLGQASPLVMRHVDDCPACRASVSEFRQALGEFRGAVRAWSDDQANAARALPDGLDELRIRTPSRQLAWALVLAAVCIIASFVIPHFRGEDAASNDAVLLNQVDSEVSRTVPSSMEPLMKLVVQNQ